MSGGDLTSSCGKCRRRIWKKARRVSWTCRSGSRPTRPSASNTKRTSSGHRRFETENTVCKSNQLTFELGSGSLDH